ncbi:MAG TPA: zf-HC2 domain-containing protein [Bryobacteraceae bacterium]|nr:zf-HC2 domain-containing protein [Bryobacteraceae bacterium]
MTCAELEVLICDYVDGTLGPDARTMVEQHLAGCHNCAELARDAAAAVGFMERAAEVEPPPELMTRLLFNAPWVHAKTPATGIKRWFGKILHPVLQPRFAMGMAMTILSFAMLARFVAPARQLRPADLSPSAVWSGLEDRVYRGWQRTVKFYESLKVVYQIQSKLHDWQQQQEEEQRTGTDAEKSRRMPDTHRLPVRGSEQQPKSH